VVVVAGAEDAGEAPVVGELDVDGGDEQVGDDGVGDVAAEQVRGHAVRHPQGPGQERPVGILDLDEAGGDERAAGPEPVAGPGVGGVQSAELEREPDAGPPPGHVVVEVAVEPLEPVVDVGGDGHEEEVLVGAVEAAVTCERDQAQDGPGRLRGGPDLVAAAPYLGGGRRGRGAGERLGQHAVDVLVADVEAAEGIVEAGVERPPGGDDGLDGGLERGQAPEHVGERGARRRGSGRP
jgi:hypothetical protein